MRLRERLDRRDDPLAQPRQRDGAVAPERLQDLGERRPGPVDEAAVPAAGAGAARLRLNEHDAGCRLALLQRQRRPEPRITAADDAEIAGDVAFEGRRSLDRAGLVQPPRRQPRLDRRLAQAVAPDRSRRIWTSTFATIATTATAKIAVPITFTCGGAPTRAAPQTKSGNVVLGPAMK